MCDERVVVVGAGPSGLAVARQLRHVHAVDALVVDRAQAPAWSWRTRYDGFRLNTCGYWSHLPGQHIPRRYGRWPKRDDMVSYFDDYVRRQRVRLRLNTEVARVDPCDGGWRLTTDRGVTSAAAVVVATGNYHTPVLPQWPGMQDFSGRVLHSADYRNAWPFSGLDVLVVGSGNSATDIALQLSDGVAGRVRMALRTPPHLVPRAAAGIPVDAFSTVFAKLPVPLLDNAGALTRRLWFGDLSDVGLPKPADGIYTALLDDKRIPTIGDELVPAIKNGAIEMVCAVEHFTAGGVVLADGATVHPDVVIAATGYHQGLEPLVGHLDVLEPDGGPVVNELPSAADGLWFMGYSEPLIGPLRSFRVAATPVADDVAAHLASVGR